VHGVDDVSGVAVEVLTSTVVDGGGARICVSGGVLHVPERDSGVKGGHDERGPQHVRVHCSEAGAFAD
jgi:hypothetical protein